jgi:hypothetical protein
MKMERDKLINELEGTIEYLQEEYESGEEIDQELLVEKHPSGLIEIRFR